MTIVEKAAYLKGLTEGLGIDLPGVGCSELHLGGTTVDIDGDIGLRNLNLGKCLGLFDLAGDCETEAKHECSK